MRPAPPLSALRAPRLTLPHTFLPPPLHTIDNSHRLLPPPLMNLPRPLPRKLDPPPRAPMRLPQRLLPALPHTPRAIMRTVVPRAQSLVHRMRGRLQRREGGQRLEERRRLTGDSALQLVERA